MDDADGELVEEVLPEAFHGDRVDRVVAAITGLSRSAAKELLENGRVRIDGVPVSSASRRAGRRFRLRCPPRPGRGRRARGLRSSPRLERKL